MIHAPVGIVTLNRYSHFRKCLESLEKCTGAAETEVFVALDYPPSEKYKEGWTDIDEYLKNKEADKGIKQLNVVRRKCNCGVGKPNGNWELLEKSLHEHYDRYIFTEDDNVFSPNFLEFINKLTTLMVMIIICIYVYLHNNSISPNADSLSIIS